MNHLVAIVVLIATALGISFGSIWVDCVGEWVRACVCGCVCARERESEIMFVGVCMCVYACVRVCVRVSKTK